MKILRENQKAVMADIKELFSGITIRRKPIPNNIIPGRIIPLTLVLDSDDIVCGKALSNPTNLYYIKIVGVYPAELPPSKISFEFIKKNFKHIMRTRVGWFQDNLLISLKNNPAIDQQKLSLIEEQYREFV